MPTLLDDLEVKYQVSIDKAEVNTMPLVEFPGQIHIIDAVSQVRSAIDALRTTPIVGFDTETRPVFKRGEFHKVALLQLAMPDHAFLFRLNLIGVPNTLLSYLEDVSCLKVGLSTTDDFHQLQRVCHCEPRGFVELQQMAKTYQIADMSLQKIYAILFHQKISKGQQLTNWEAPKLSVAQQHYAAIDAWACIAIYKYLQSGQFIPEQSPYWHQVTED